MLETRNLKKIYKTKRGVSVTALKDVSLKFPEKGMVFLLGKSGSGKSTLLNLLGGLDQYSDGEIIIKGESSKNFSQSQFDSYRNTYVGFIFQEYNVLEEFTVGANIALAIELQGRKAEDSEINDILKKVDLDGFGDRKPNELSGGQKQRVAIARALVKNPQIIMADEPTGALDSATGRQVLDTLKKLSADKLVIVVSHDREFAERYGDRIIELADGNVINDVERTTGYANTDVQNGFQGNQTVSYEVEEQGIVFEKDTMIIPAGYHLTEADRNKINEYISNLGGQLNAKISKGDGGKFAATDQSKIKMESGNFQLIKSKLPMKNSFKIGASGLKHKKIRLVVTILLSFIAFTMFALADTFSSYDHINTCTNSIKDTEITYASVAKSMKYTDDGFSYWIDWGFYLTEEDIDAINKDTNLGFQGVYVPDEDLSMNNYDKSVQLSENDEYNHYATSFSGFAEISKNGLDKMGYELVAGVMPDGNKDEIAISEYVYETYAKAGYLENNDVNQKQNIERYEDFIGKKLLIGSAEYTVTGIVDTKVDMQRYAKISEDMTKMSTTERLASYALSNELGSIQSYSLSCIAITGQGRVQKMLEENGNFISMNQFSMWLEREGNYADATSIAKLSDIDISKVTWIDGERKQLGDKEIIVSSDSFSTDTDDHLSMSEVLETIKNAPEYTMSYAKYPDYDYVTEEGWKIVGVIDTTDGNEKYSDLYVLPDGFYDKGWDEGQGDYAFAVASMPESKDAIKDLVTYCNTEQNGMKYKMQNSVTYELDSVNEILEILSKVFLYVGIGFALFAALMLSNFIATSISYKKQEIGILRAIGARSNDVFRIFFSESFIIAMINFVLACIGTGIATAAINGAIRNEAGILITILNFGVRQIGLLFVISIFVAAVASFIPVYKIASKKPIEAIRNR